MTSYFAPAAIALGLTAAAAAPAMAGSYSPAPAEPVIVPAVPAAAPDGDWGGAYLGLSYGYIDVNTDSGASDDSSDALGIHAGYRWDFGKTVAGLEVEYGEPDLDFVNSSGTQSGSVDNVWRIKGQYGYDFGRTLAYATAGIAPTDTSLGDETGYLVGVGVDYQMTQNWVMGAEVLYHDFDEFGSSGVGADATTAAVRLSYRF
ncbi:outer membrane protein [Rhodovulum sulfidophilum]|uniref:Porin family protein n=1 Tax=Rhodovulum sulfidophilum TaxID=35806 RepID=A0ABS1RWB3_RHOSU|nr:outer membrane beta-barrel protein [Rhodovulum sulfidophilum]MBL3610386.1 porin family protein [Rhodovulum sulfidophilum]MCE8457013.1 porin family protein [Rhodovulum sulfidophilum]